MDVFNHLINDGVHITFEEVSNFSMIYNNSNDIDRVRTLLERYKLLGLVDELLTHPFFIRAISPEVNVDILRLMLSYASDKEIIIKTINMVGMTLLHHVCASGQIDVLLVLLSSISDENKADIINKTVLVYDDIYMSSFKLACACGHVDIVAELLNILDIDVEGDIVFDNNVPMEQRQQITAMINEYKSISFIKATHFDD